MKFLNILKCFKKKVNEKEVNDVETQNIPSFFNPNEKILRSVFSPINLKKDGVSLQNNIFKPPPGIDEISVNRLDYTTVDFCKLHSLKIQNPESDRNFFGFALLYCRQIFQIGCDIEYSVEPENIYHSNIKIGFIPERGVPLPAEFQQKVSNLTKQSKLFIDPKPKIENWEGEDII